MKGIVAVGPEYFRKSLRDYSDWRWAFWREFIQNGVDCGSKRIEITMGDRCSNNLEALVTVENDGKSMTRQELIDKLLSLGASGKDGVTTVGGFGKAKEILYFAHRRYEIVTGNLHVTGSGGSFEVQELPTTRVGTVSRVWVNAEYSFEPEYLRGSLRAYLKLLRTKTRVSLDGKEEERLRIGRELHRDDAFRICRLNSGDGIVVMTRGLPMFVHASHSGYVCELLDNSYEMLASSRDQLTRDHRGRFEQLVNRIASETLSFGRPQNRRLAPIATSGMRFTGYVEEPKDPIEICEAELQIQDETVGLQNAVIEVGTQEFSEELYRVWPNPTPVDPGLIRYRQTVTQQGSQLFGQVAASERQFRVMLRSETGRVPYARYWRRDCVSPTIVKSLHRWSSALRWIYGVMKDPRPFTVGLVFCAKSEDGCTVQALCSAESDDVTYLLNPLDLDGRLAWRSSTQHAEMLAVALHEYCHSLGHDVHDERYSSKLTYLIGRMLDAGPKLSKLFRVESFERRIGFNWPTGWEASYE